MGGENKEVKGVRNEMCRDGGNQNRAGLKKK